MQFRLPKVSPIPTGFGAVKTLYYQEVKKFLSYPLMFTGCRHSSSSSKRRLIFETIVFRHTEDITRCYDASNDLFRRFERGIEQYKEWLVLGQVDVEELVEDSLHDVSDWERNFRVLKLRGQEAEKLPKYVKKIFSKNTFSI